MNETELCALLNVRYPLIQAPMAGGWTTPELAAAVSESGGFGVLAGARVAPERLREDIRAVKSLTRRPFGVNLLLSPPTFGPRDPAQAQAHLNRLRRRLGLPETEAVPESREDRWQEQLAVLVEEEVPVLSIGMGDPEELAPEARRSGLLVLSMVTSVAEARRAELAGVDAIVAQGAEAGGHRSTFLFGPDGEPPLVGTLALVPQVVDAVQVPVVAAGGIVEGRGLAAALALGAAGVQMGTRFLLARESGAHPAYRRSLLAATEEETVVTRVFSGHPARGLRNAYVREYLRSGPEPLAYPRQRAAAQDIYAAGRERDDPDHSQMLAGQGLRLLEDEEVGAAEVVERVVREADEVIRGLSGGPGESKEPR